MENEAEQLKALALALRLRELATLNHAQPGRVAREPRILERDVFERAQAVPTLLAGHPVSIRPALRCRACDDEIEAIDVGVLAGLGFAFDVE